MIIESNWPLNELDIILTATLNVTLNVTLTVTLAVSLVIRYQQFIDHRRTKNNDNALWLKQSFKQKKLP